MIFLGLHLQPAPIGQLQLNGKLPGDRAGAEQGVDPGFKALLIKQGQVKQSQGRAGAGFFIDQIFQQVLRRLILSRQPRAGGEGRIVLGQLKVRRVQVAEQLGGVLGAGR